MQPGQHTPLICTQTPGREEDETTATSKTEEDSVLNEQDQVLQPDTARRTSGRRCLGGAPLRQGPPAGGALQGG